LFFPGKHFLSSQIFVSKAGAYSSGTPLCLSTLG
jgi:hypothetical protein